MHVKLTFVSILAAILSVFQQTAHAQCTTVINTFPYTENFEASNGNWQRSSATHWEWGTIGSKPVINAAGSGTKCWVVGGLSGSSYNSSVSYLTSPCFDISSLANPQISFKVFWETERRYDGASLEYSVDGVSWQILGSINSNANCEGENWFNYDPIHFLGDAGWSGNIQPTSGSCQGTGGSGGWVTAKHTLNSIAGSTAVRFRFVFAAGTTCNAFDGFALDDMRIAEAPSAASGFTYTCTSSNTVSFSSTSALCRTGVTWNFGDAASGSNNTSTATDPVHTFSGPGRYTVTLTTTFVSGSPAVVSEIVNVINATAVVDSIKCATGSTGSIAVNVTPSGTYNYTWNTNPVQTTPTISGLAPGTYTVNITGTNTCSNSLTATLIQPSALTLSTNVVDAKCSNNNGSITTTVSGGTSPYGYVWSNGATTPSLSAIAAGTYAVTITDAKGCTINSGNLVVNTSANNLSITLGPDLSICPGQQVILSPGNFSRYTWQDNSTNPTFTAMQSGNYAVTVTDANGCTGSAAVNVTVDCPEIYFPSAFTPNGDGINDFFGPLGNLSVVRNYKLTVYGRWGEIIFSSTDPFKKWDGTFKGKYPGTQAFVWLATFNLANFAQELRSGTITIIH